jgi:hypothetical protein
MKTTKQTSQEIMQKIEERKYARMQVRKKVRRAWALAVVLGFFIPTTLYSVTESFDINRPLSFPFQQEQPKEEPPHDTESHAREPEINQTALPM